MEVLKQPQYQPLPVEQQVMIIYAAINNHLAKVGVEHVKDFEKEFLEYMTSMYHEVGESIKKENKLTEENEAVLKEAIDKFVDRYLRKIGAQTLQPDEAVEEEAEAEK